MYTIEQLNDLTRKLEYIKSQQDRLLGEEAQLLKTKEELKQEFIKAGVTVEGLPVLEKQLAQEIDKIAADVSKIIEEVDGKL